MNTKMQLKFQDRLLQSLYDLKNRANVTNALLVTEDGFVIASDDFKQIAGNLSNLGHYDNIGAISAGALSMAEQAIKIIDSQKQLHQILIEAGNEINSAPFSSDCFSIILSLVEKNVILLAVFPSQVNLGLLLYEIQRTKDEIRTNLTGVNLVHKESVL